MSESIQFKAVIRQHGNMNAAYVEFPFSTEQVFGKKGQIKIKAIFDDHVEYRGSLARMKSDFHMVGLPKEIRKQLGKTFGDEVSVFLTEDKEERTVDIAEDIVSVFSENWEAQIVFDKMRYTHRKEYIRWIEEAKKPETRENRKRKMIEMILNGKKSV
ncbi:YdeI/OmpD-associated family protein [Chryseobacterium sp. SSA4.19]|uniref:YdeI/OmpD-associated family protein n=1 Tax=Chryseobacterium sp. SSA4.19 TaxID=2919915 RepID=UPI001F4E1E9A|nr:YdeI/OmpD-associated family protein [Chryseobacterium sp. SSA4.19]MCJ8155596.1 YdeI/OmpD-associated family protein [Chryseobacterium sp. SSA4.19]